MFQKEWNIEKWNQPEFSSDILHFSLLFNFFSLLLAIKQHIHQTFYIHTLFCPILSMISSQMSLIQSLDKKHNEMSELAIQIDFGLLVSNFCSVRYGLVDQKELFFPWLHRAYYIKLLSEGKTQGPYFSLLPDFIPLLIDKPSFFSQVLSFLGLPISRAVPPCLILNTLPRYLSCLSHCFLSWVPANFTFLRSLPVSPLFSFLIITHSQADTISCLYHWRASTWLQWSVLPLISVL